MKTLMLVSELEDYAVTVANGVAPHANVVLAVPRRRYAALAGEFSPGVDLRLIDWPRHSSPHNPRFLFELSRLVAREKPDIIHMLSNTVLWLNVAMPFWKAPILTTVHDVEVHPGDTETAILPEWATRLAARQSGDLLVHGARLRALAARRFTKPLDRVHVVPHPAIVRYADLAGREGIERRRASGGPFSLLLFGRIFAYKGLSQLIRSEALIGTGGPDLRVVIAGRGDDAWAHRDLMGDPSRYEVRNEFIPDGDVARLFLDADAVALPYVEGSQSGVLNLAAAFGKPVIATDVGELGATVSAHGLGLVVPSGDPARFAAAVTTLATRPDLAARLGANALAWAQGPNSPTAVGATTASLYREIVARTGGEVAHSRLDPSRGQAQEAGR